jgi:hypothetical protein
VYMPGNVRNQLGMANFVVAGSYEFSYRQRSEFT